jgi:hypothetical protein
MWKLPLRNAPTTRARYQSLDYSRTVDLPPRLMVAHALGRLATVGSLLMVVVLELAAVAEILKDYSAVYRVAIALVMLGLAWVAWPRLREFMGSKS